MSVTLEATVCVCVCVFFLFWWLEATVEKGNPHSGLNNVMCEGGHCGTEP
jgi:hypothetical protein